MLIFVHLPKTAGTTLARIIERNYGSAAVLSLYGSSTGEELATMSAAALAQFRAVMGHFSFGAHRFLPTPSPYITMLREPVDRVISHYYFVRRQPEHYLYDTARRLTLRDFVVECGTEEPNNDQTRLLAGHCGPVRSRALDDEMLVTAKRNLRDHVVVTGISEHFDESVVLMKRRLGWRTPFYSSENVSSGRPPRGQIDVETLQVVEAYNQLDLDLYRHARSLLEVEQRLYGT
jgi:hypothetical protein